MENPKNSGENKQKKTPGQAAYVLIESGIEFAVMLGLPLYLFILLGKWLDAKYQTKFFVLAGILLALALSSAMVYKKIRQVEKLFKDK